MECRAGACGGWQADVEAPCRAVVRAVAAPIRQLHVDAEVRNPQVEWAQVARKGVFSHTPHHTVIAPHAYPGLRGRARGLYGVRYLLEQELYGTIKVSKKQMTEKGLGLVAAGLYLEVVDESSGLEDEDPIGMDDGNDARGALEEESSDEPGHNDLSANTSDARTDARTDALNTDARINVGASQGVVVWDKTQQHSAAGGTARSQAEKTAELHRLRESILQEAEALGEAEPDVPFAQSKDAAPLSEEASTAVKHRGKRKALAKTDSNVPKATGQSAKVPRGKQQKVPDQPRVTACGHATSARARP